MATPTTLPASFVSGAVLEAAQLNNLRGAFRVLQVVSAVKTDTFTTTSTTYTDVTGLSVSITPSATSSKVLIIAQIAVGNVNGGANGFFQLTGGNSGTYIGDAASNRVRSVFGGYSSANQGEVLSSFSVVYLDSPATTSATTYKVQGRVGTIGPTPTLYVNRSQVDADTNAHGRGASSITVLEISA